MSARRQLPCIKLDSTQLSTVQYRCNQVPVFRFRATLSSGFGGDLARLSRLRRQRKSNSKPNLKSPLAPSRVCSGHLASVLVTQVQPGSHVIAAYFSLFTRNTHSMLEVFSFLSASTTQLPLELVIYAALFLLPKKKQNSSHLRTNRQKGTKKSAYKSHALTLTGKIARSDKILSNRLTILTRGQV